jgi:hypothetical protein
LRFTLPTVGRDRRGSHHHMIDQVEQERLIAELRTAMLALRTHVNARRRDRHAKQTHKDVQQRKNKAPETLGTLLTSSWNERAPLADIERIGAVISAFFRGCRRGLIRAIGVLIPLETQIEGDLRCAEVAIAQGDHTAPMLLRLVDDIDMLSPILTEMKESVLEELYGPKEVRV